MAHFLHNHKGQSLLEVVVAMAVFALFAASLVTLSTGGFAGLEQGGEYTQAAALADEGIEAVRSVRDHAYNELVFVTSSVGVSGGRWVFSGEGTTEVVGQFTRTISFEDVCRDGAGEVAACPASYADVHTKQVAVAVSWDTGIGVENVVERFAYVTNWDSADWVQTDWSGGDGQGEWSNTTQYDSDDGNTEVSGAGEVSLASLGGSGCGTQSWPFTTALNYTYDTNKIEVTGGVAQLLATSTVGGTGNTTNADFDTDTSGWSFDNQWGDNVGASGAHQATGGNPNGWVSVNLGTKKKKEGGAYWEQSFTVSESSITTAELDFDWQVTAYDGSPAPDAFNLYVYVDTSSGDPTLGTDVWDSGAISATSGWVSVTDLDVSSAVTGPGTYYIKVAAYVDYPNANSGPFTVGYDNVYLDWTGAGGGASYPTDNPVIQPTSSFAPSSIGAWTSFSETATKDGGEIYYQLSDNDGSTWQYWNGSSWVSAGSTNYNTASVIDTNISDFSTTTGQIMFKSFLESDGSQGVSIDEVQVSCAERYSWPFTTALNYTYDTNKIEVTGGVAQLLATSTVGGTGNTTNADFDTDTSGWSFDNQWGDNVGASGAHQATGGNPNGWVSVNLGTKKKKEGGAYWEQSFTVSESSITTAELDFDWQVTAYDGSPAPDAFNLYVYVDTSSGDPTLGTDVWDSGAISATSGWVSVTDLDVSSAVTGPGTYYIKVAAYVDYPNANSGPFTVGYDNVYLDWTGAGGGASYPTDNPVIQPTSSFAPSSIGAWTSFSETATKDGGEIYYQLSDNDGSTWQYWNGSSWVSAGSTNYNTASVIDTNISDFSTTTGQIMFKSFLESDGSQGVQLDQVRVEYAASGDGGGGGGSGYETSAWLLSSAFDMGDSSPAQIVEWDQTIPVCSPICSVQLQVRTAPDSGGSPGTWTSWYGTGGAGTYFTDSLGTRMSTDLNGNQWMQYRVELSGDGNETPILQEVRVNYK